jgi:hypothetical protein
MRKPNRFKLLHPEQLEPRTMLAGDVGVQVLNGDAIITGDAAANNLFIQGTTVFGRNDAGGVATSINGVPNGSFDFSAFTRDLIVQTQAGGDVVEIGGVTVPRQLTVNTGADSDLIQINPVAYRANSKTLLQGDTGSDRILINGQATSLGSNPPLHRTSWLQIDGNTGNDEIRVSDILADQITIEMGFDADLAEVKFAVVTFLTQINGWHGYDFISVDTCYMRTASINPNAHQGSIHVRNSYFLHTLGITTASQNDFISVEGTRVDLTTAINTNDALPNDVSQDYILIKTSSLNVVQIDTGGGSDRVEVEASAIVEFYANLAEDADWLILSNSAFHRAVQADGGSGFDLFTSRGNVLNGSSFNGFEAFN